MKKKIETTQSIGLSNSRLIRRKKAANNIELNKIEIKFTGFLLYENLLCTAAAQYPCERYENR